MGMLLLNGSSEFGVRRELFANNEQGLWLDPSDMNATKAGWRRNLLTQTETFSGWTVSNATLSSGVSDPEGGTTAFTLTATSPTGLVRLLPTVSSGVAVVQSIWIRRRTGTGNVTSYRGQGLTSSTLTLTSDWQRLSVTGTTTGTNDAAGIIISTSGDAIDIWHPQIELGSTPTEYQRITDFSTEFKAAFPTHTLYQDSNGVTPCTAAGDPVGLILDQSRGGLGALGPELMTNGGFTSDSNWVKGTSAVIANGYLEQPTGTGSFSYQVFPTQAGKWYRVTFDILQGTFYAGVWSVAPTGTILGGGNSYTPSSRVIWFIANDNDAAFSFVCNEGIGRIDNISVREVPGNHAYQTTSGARPTLARIPSCGRRNLLLQSNNFSDSYWSRSEVTLAKNAGVGPDGQPLWTITGTYAGTVQAVYSSAISVLAGQVYTFSVYLRQATPSRPRLRILNVATTVTPMDIVLEWSGGVPVVQSSSGVVGSVNIQEVSSGLFRVSAAFSTGAQTSLRCWLYTTNQASSANLIAGCCQFELGSTVTPYQQVTVNGDVTESGFNDLWHLVFDGSDDSLVTNSVDFSGTDEMTVIAGVRKLSDALGTVFCELSASVSSNNGTFVLLAPNQINATKYVWVAKGTSLVEVETTAAAPTTNVLTCLADISAPSTQLRNNGSVAQTKTDTLGTGNFGNYQLFIGRRNNGTVPYNGHLYQLIIRGKTTPTGKLLEAEKFVSKKTGVNL